MIFNFAGTLSDTYPVSTDALLALTRKYGIETDYDTAYKLLKQSTVIALTHYNLNLSLVEARKEYEDIYCPLAHTKQPLFPSAKNVLEFAKQHYLKCYIYTFRSMDL